MEINNDWIVGFVDGDGCLKVTQTADGKRFCFVVSQDKRSVEVLYALKKHFSCGGVHKAGGNMFEYRVTKKEDLQQIILPFFEKNPLQTQKWNDFRILSEELQQQPITPLTKKRISRDWLVGFTDAEGCFPVSMVSNYPRPQFLIGLHPREKDVLEEIQKFLDCGTIYERPKSPTPCVVFQISSMDGFEKITKIMTTGTNRVLLRTKKRISFLKWKQVVRMIKTKQHLTEKGVEKIKKILQKDPNKAKKNKRNEA